MMARKDSQTVSAMELQTLLYRWRKRKYKRRKASTCVVQEAREHSGRSCFALASGVALCRGHILRV